MTGFLEDIADNVRGMNLRQMEAAYSQIDEKYLPVISKIALDIVYGRYECSCLGIDYNRINHADFLRAKIAAWGIISADSAADKNK